MTSTTVSGHRIEHEDYVHGSLRIRAVAMTEVWDQESFRN